MTTELTLDDMEIVGDIQNRLANLMGQGFDAAYCAAHVKEIAVAKYPRFPKSLINQVIRDGIGEYRSQLRHDGHG